MALKDIPHPPSSNIAQIVWDDETLELFISFQKGAIYRYDQVPESVANGFSQAISATDYLRGYIESEYIPVRVG